MNLENAIDVVPMSIFHVLLCPQAVPKGYHSMDYAQAVTQNPYAYTALLDGAPIVLAGVLPLWLGVGEAWSYISSEATHRPFWLHRTVKRIFDQICMEHHFHRLQANCEENSKEIKWLISLGFKEEGLMKKYSPEKKDMVRLAKVID